MNHLVLPELTGNRVVDACVAVDEYEFQWVTACLMELTEEGKLTQDDEKALIGDLLENS